MVERNVRGAALAWLRAFAKLLVMASAMLPLAVIPLLHGWSETRDLLDNLRAGRLELYGHTIPFALLWTGSVLTGGAGVWLLWVAPWRSVGRG